MPEWVTALVALLTGGGLVALLRTLLLRRAEQRKLSADAEAVEVRTRVEAETSEFGRIEKLLDRYERRHAELERRLEEAEKQLALLREEVAELRPKAKLVPLLEEEVRRLRDELVRLQKELEGLSPARARVAP